ncbi:hypothetical protein Dsin_022602 [Dipteronia sinensis]|uniref:Reverse transcriptase zinc-binding domain-containing protein n=1 Tax=Dipteronia sinensis TaxID=43782 RepID=A0AAE0A2P7_9ROSI|nr:hypothetical protein Dsin_022602 [Dipteronia sinensis]
MSESRRLVSRHSKVHFWTDNWLGDPLIDLVEDRSSLQPLLDSVVDDIYSDSTGWDIPKSFRASHPDVASEIEKVVVRSSVFRGKHIWASFIPPSRSVLIWRLFHGKIPTDIALRARGYISPSRCRFCRAAEEDLKHLFLDYPFVRGLWNAVSSTFGRKLKLDGTCLDLWQEAMGVQLKALWLEDSLQSGTMKKSVDELQTLHQLHVSGIFRTCRGFVKSCFAIPLGVCFAFGAELTAAVHTIDYAWTFGWRRLWLESDSTFVVDTLRSRSRKVPWRWRPVWDRCLSLISQMDFAVTHIYREGYSAVKNLDRLKNQRQTKVKLYDHRIINRGHVQSYEGHVNSRTRIQLGVHQSERFVMSGNFVGTQDGRQSDEDSQFGQSYSSNAWIQTRKEIFHMHWMLYIGIIKVLVRVVYVMKQQKNQCEE